MGANVSMHSWCMAAGCKTVVEAGVRLVTYWTVKAMLEPVDTENIAIEQVDTFDHETVVLNVVWQDLSLQIPGCSKLMSRDMLLGLETLAPQNMMWDFWLEQMVHVLLLMPLVACPGVRRTGRGLLGLSIVNAVAGYLYWSDLWFVVRLVHEWLYMAARPLQVPDLGLLGYCRLPFLC